MFDAHRHLGQSYRENALYATSSHVEWAELLQLNEPAIAGVGALGDTPLPSIEEFETILHAQPGFQVAEVGLDRRFEAMVDQERFLRDILSLAWSLSRSVTLHCVNEDGRMLKLLRSMRPNLPVLLWHGFTGSWETAREASKMGVILSYGQRLYRSKLAKEGEKLIGIPYALETDFQGGEYQMLFTSHARKFSKLCNCTIDTLIRNNDETRTILAHNTPSR